MWGELKAKGEPSHVYLLPTSSKRAFCCVWADGSLSEDVKSKTRQGGHLTPLYDHLIRIGGVYRHPISSPPELESPSHSTV